MCIDTWNNTTETLEDDLNNMNYYQNEKEE
jgi:hypothetical protein